MLPHMPELCWDEPVIPCEDNAKLSKWVDQVSTKRDFCWSKPRRNYRMEAILTHTLYKAKRELKRKKLSWSTRPYYCKREDRNKQAEARRMEMDAREEMKENLYGTCVQTLVPEWKAEESTEKGTTKWDDEFVKDVEDVLSNLDSFMNEVNKVQTVVQR
ncbi:PREDICTED: uncharacterized protein LOC106745010 [Dinoponera quadriceps]|uniref:Uncharacterized protein LOC106745010 n=1 Tax=Dinoponera quadriceps TaxID=609295 RepID=A0A6P3XBR9_DINQU|nr:PREDICTED: uncharacterized protein LOC106745010 [Dinoponera quadriceps]